MTADKERRYGKHPRKLLVIIAEAAIERELVRGVMRLGAHGYTTYDVRGSGSKGKRDSNWEPERTIEMKVLCDEKVADKIAAELLDRWALHYSVTFFIAEVTVFRPERY